MRHAQSSLPPKVRKVLGRWRTSAIRSLGGVVPSRGLSYEELVDLLFPHIDDPKFREDIDRVGDSDLTNPSTIRRMIGVVEQQLSPTAFTVRFGPGDVYYQDVHGITLALDMADASVANQMQQSGNYETHLTAVFEKFCLEGMTVVDVGANIGYYTLLASRLVGPSGKVLAIEPNSENCRLLITSLSLQGASNVKLMPVACSKQSGWAYFSSHLGSNGGFIPATDVIRRPGTVVPVFPLDELVKSKVDFLKLDVEGAEALVVSGAQELLTTHRPIISTEFSCDMLNRVSEVEPKEYLEGFVALGYEMSVIDRLTGKLIEIESPDHLLSSWDDPYRIEDLLLLPR